MQAKIDKLKTKANNASDTAKTEMREQIEELEKQNKHWASSQAPSVQSDGSLRLHHMRAQTSLTVALHHRC